MKLSNTFLVNVLVINIFQYIKFFMYLSNPVMINLLSKVSILGF